MGVEQFDEMPTAEQYRSLVRESAVFSSKQLSNHASLRLDIRETNRNQLLMAGLLPEHIEMPGICTGCRTDLFSRTAWNTVRLDVFLLCWQCMGKGTLRLKSA